MGFLGDYYLEIKAGMPGDRSIIFPKLHCEKWVKHFDFDVDRESEYDYMGRISISLSEEYYFFMVNEHEFNTLNPEYSIENLLSKEEFKSLPVSVYSNDYWYRPFVFNSGWEETVNPIHLQTLNNALLKELELTQQRISGIQNVHNKKKIQELAELHEEAKKIKLFCEFAIFYFVRPTVIAI